jgi:hypothetical protein
MWTAVQNPSSLELTTVRMAVIPGEYSAEVFNTESQKFEAANSSVNCFQDTVSYQASKPFDNCWLTVEAVTQPRAFSLLQVKPLSSERQGSEEAIKIGDSIETNQTKLTLSDFCEKCLQFEYINKESNLTETVTVELQNWDSFIDKDWFQKADGEWGLVNPENQNSGDYIFRPWDKQYEPRSYSKYLNGTISTAQPGQLMSFYFNSGDAINPEMATLLVSIDADLGVLKFDLDLDSLPPIDSNGTEVIVNFKVTSFNNNGTFWTDSNGLEMQERRINYRPTWDI